MMSSRSNVSSASSTSSSTSSKPLEKWYFTKEQLDQSPSRKAGVDAEKELSYRQQAANLIQDIGQRLKVTQLVINTAIVYMHRFYTFHSFTKFHRNAIAACAAFLAAKVEEQPRKLEYVIKAAQLCIYGKTETKNEAYLQIAADLVYHENLMLRTLGFELNVQHPHTWVVRCCQLLRASKEIAQTSYFMATNSLHLTTMCLQYKPSVVACICIHLIKKWGSYEFQMSNEGRPWHSYVDNTVTPELLESLTDDFIAIFEKCPSRMRKMLSQCNPSAVINDGGEGGLASMSRQVSSTVTQAAASSSSSSRLGTNSNDLRKNPPHSSSSVHQAGHQNTSNLHFSQQQQSKPYSQQPHQPSSSDAYRSKVPPPAKPAPSIRSDPAGANYQLARAQQQAARSAPDSGGASSMQANMAKYNSLSSSSSVISSLQQPQQNASSTASLNQNSTGTGTNNLNYNESMFDSQFMGNNSASHMNNNDNSNSDFDSDFGGGGNGGGGGGPSANKSNQNDLDLKMEFSDDSNQDSNPGGVQSSMGGLTSSLMKGDFVDYSSVLPQPQTNQQQPFYGGGSMLRPVTQAPPPPLSSQSILPQVATPTFGFSGLLPKTEQPSSSISSILNSLNNSNDSTTSKPSTLYSTIPSTSNKYLASAEETSSILALAAAATATPTTSNILPMMQQQQMHQQQQQLNLQQMDESSTHSSKRAHKHKKEKHKKHKHKDKSERSSSKRKHKHKDKSSDRSSGKRHKHRDTLDSYHDSGSDQANHVQSPSSASGGSVPPPIKVKIRPPKEEGEGSFSSSSSPSDGDSSSVPPPIKLKISIPKRTPSQESPLGDETSSTNGGHRKRKKSDGSRESSKKSRSKS